MTKEQYLIIIELPELPMTAWFEYYLERGGAIKDFEQFQHVFSVILWNESSMQGPDGVLKQVTFHSALQSFYHYYAKKFDLWQERT